ncbi:sugar phosphate isomerase/epimerase [Brevibacillus ruminantium]|uniref:Sugar phosphate isomerase/epimerase n=1 Tax=Brevibacillus ruminantium TaxID=2950604 RepID=A0ABY4WEY3_9BACL|nr:sugar phosphate isomerase/epimerase family protein [Brevibacillus ruminantium]USG65617.1 sugar phosphate isomerase/epimerase [Brevibacillus ruminantium]
MGERGSVTISTYALFDQPLEQAVRQIIEDGWKSIEIMCEAGHSELLRWPKEKQKEFKQAGIEQGITWSIHAPIEGCNPAAESGKLRDQSLEMMKRCLELAVELDSAHVVMHAGEVHDRLDEAERARGVEQVQRFVEPLVSQLSGTETVLTLENVPPYPKVLGWTVSDLVEICARTDSQQLGIVYDVGHAHLIREGYALEALQEVFPYLMGLHLSDNHGLKDDHLAVGEGSIPYSAILAWLKENKYAGSWVLETTSLADARLSLQRLKEL